MLNRQWLRTFRALVSKRSFTRAAEHLGVTQAAVSQHVRYLEERLGSLIIRHPRDIEMTPAGRALLAYCEDLEHADERLKRQLSSHDSTHGAVRLITPGSVGLLLYPFLLGLQRDNSGIIIHHRFAPDSEILEAVINNRYELGIVTQKPDDPRLTAHRFAEEPLELIAPLGFALTQWDALETLGFIDHPDGQAMANRLFSMRFPNAPGISSIPIRGFSNQVSLILEPVSRGFGFTVLPKYARKAFTKQHLIQIVDCETCRAVDTLWAIHRAEWPLSGVGNYALSKMQDYLARPDV